MVSLLTGGAGFLGSHVAEHLLQGGHQVVVLDDLSGGFKSNLDPRATFVHGSIEDAALVLELFERYRFDYVYHLAAYAAEGLSHHIRAFNYGNNLLGSTHLINASIRYEVKCFVFTSSIAVYGTQAVPLRESALPSPEDPYGIAKYAVEMDLAAARKHFGLQSVIFRPHNVYGERQHIGDHYRNVVGIFMNQIMQGKPLTVFGDGKQSRAFSYVKDVAPIIARAVHVPEAYDQMFNIGADQDVTVTELAEMVMTAMRKRVDIHYLPERNEVKHAYADHAKLHATFGDVSNTPLEIGIKHMADWAWSIGPQQGRRFDRIEIDRNLPEVWKTV
jgi:UDP-glucose 4-epimerase